MRRCEVCFAPLPAWEDAYLWPCAHGHRYASSHAGSGAKHTSHRRIRIPPFRLQNYYAFG